MNRSFNKPKYNNYMYNYPNKKSSFLVNSYFDYQDGFEPMIDIVHKYIEDNMNPMIYRMLNFRRLHDAIMFQANNNWSDNNYAAMIKSTESGYACVIEYTKRNKPIYRIGVDYSDPECFDKIMKFMMCFYNGQ